MSKPEVTQDNWQAVYEYYAAHRGSKSALRALHRGSSFVYHPRVEYADDSSRKIDALLDADTRLIVASNHVRELDQFPLAAMMQRGPLHRIIGNTVSLAKQPLFKTPLRRPLDAVGAVPVWREPDFKSGISGREKNDINKAFFKLVVDHMEDGASVFMFPEGTRNSHAQHEIGPIKPGIGRIVLNCVQRDVPVAIVPVALLWPGNGERHSFRPDITVGAPLDELEGMTVRQITSATAEGMADAVLFRPQKSV